MTPSVDTLAAVVAQGLSSSPRSLPPWVFYDAAGSALYEQITALEEYYPSRTESAILERHGAALAGLMTSGEPLTVVELGAGTAKKTVSLLRALVARAPITFVPVDVSGSALEVARTRVQHEIPEVEVRPLLATHERALAQYARAPGPRAVLFIGSSIGNFDDTEAIALLSAVRQALGPGGTLVLGTDLIKSPATMVRAYDDALGVTARFNLNALARINRELGGEFRLEQFRHVALWNEGRSRIEMHLESLVAQEVRVAALGRTFAFAEGERIHTESSVKYGLAHIDRLLEAAGLRRRETFYDRARWCAVHLVNAQNEEAT